MCGIVGISFSTRMHYLDPVKAEKAREVFTNMMTAAQERGSSASGLYVVKKVPGKEGKFAVHTFKSPLSARRLVGSEAYKKVLSLIDQDTYHIVGHTRAVTGNAPATNNRNNHPHVVGKFIGVHNGVIKNDSNIWNQLAPHNYKPSGRCDSESAMALLDYAYKNALSKAVGKPTEEERKQALYAACRFASAKLAGWYTLVFTCFDLPTRVCILRDGAFSEMDMVQINPTGMVAFASTDKIVDAAIASAKITDVTAWTPQLGETTILNSALEYQAKKLKVETAKTSKVLVKGEDKLSAEEEKELAVTKGLKK